MTLSAVDMEPSSPSPPPEGAAAPPTADPAAEHATAAEASAPKSHVPAKPPAASLLGLMVKGKASGPAKAGDLTRFFEIAHRQAKPAPQPSEPLVSELPPPTAIENESVPPVDAVAPTETPIADARPETAPLESTTPSMPEAVASALPVVTSEPSLEPSFPLLLAPPAVVEINDSARRAAIEQPAAGESHHDEPAIPDWVTAASEDESALVSEPEPLKVALVPAEELPPTTATTDAVAEASSAPEVSAEATPASAIGPASAQAEPSIAPERPEPPPTAPIEPAIAAAAPPPAPEPSAVAAPPVAPRTPVFKELVDYWRSLRSGDDHPATELVDRDLVTERWPGTLLIAYTPASQDPRGELRPGRVTRLGSACAETQNAVEAGSHSTEWMLEVARTALVNDEPVEEQQRLATVKGVAGFRMVALPLGPPRALPTAVLCTLMPSPAAPRFGKRRVWL